MNIKEKMAMIGSNLPLILMVGVIGMLLILMIGVVFWAMILTSGVFMTIGITSGITLIGCLFREWFVWGEAIENEKAEIERQEREAREAEERAEEEEKEEKVFKESEKIMDSKKDVKNFADGLEV